MAFGQGLPYTVYAMHAPWASLSLPLCLLLFTDSAKGQFIVLWVAVLPTILLIEKNSDDFLHLKCFVMIRETAILILIVVAGVQKCVVCETSFIHGQKGNFSLLSRGGCDTVFHKQPPHKPQFSVILPCSQH